MLVIVTGIHGFLGSIIANELTQRGDKVIGLNSPRSTEDSAENRKLSNCKHSYSTETLAKIFEDNNPDAVIHTGTDYGLGDYSYSDTLLNNVALPIRLLETAIRHGTRFFINADTFYNKPGTVSRYKHPYSYSKFAFNEIARILSRSSGLRYVNMRLEHMYGPGENSSKFCSLVIRSCLRNVPYLNLSSGHQMRDFVNAADVSHAFLLVLDRGLQGISLDPEYSVGSGTAVSVQSFVNLVEKLTKTTTKIHFGSVSQGDGELYFSEANIHPLIKLGWRPRISLVEGILSYLDTQEVK